MIRLLGDQGYGIDFTRMLEKLCVAHAWHHPGQPTPPTSSSTISTNNNTKSSSTISSGDSDGTLSVTRERWTHICVRQWDFYSASSWRAAPDPIASSTANDSATSQLGSPASIRQVNGTKGTSGHIVTTPSGVTPCMSCGVHDMLPTNGAQLIESFIGDGGAQLPLWLFDHYITTSLVCPYFSAAIRRGLQRRRDIHHDVTALLVHHVLPPLVPLILTYAHAVPSSYTAANGASLPPSSSQLDRPYITVFDIPSTTEYYSWHSLQSHPVTSQPSDYRTRVYHRLRVVEHKWMTMTTTALLSSRGAAGVEVPWLTLDESHEFHQRTRTLAN